MWLSIDKLGAREIEKMHNGVKHALTDQSKEHMYTYIYSDNRTMRMSVNGILSKRNVFSACALASVCVCLFVQRECSF